VQALIIATINNTMNAVTIDLLAMHIPSLLFHGLYS